MTMRGRPIAPSSDIGPPTAFPSGNPPAAPFDHSFTLQAVMELQKSVAVLGEKIDRMSDDVQGMSGRIESASTRMDTLKHWQTVVTTGALVVAAIVGIIWSVVTFVPWERIQIAPVKEEAKK